MSQMSLLDPGHEPALDRWYLEHLRNMAAVPGISSAQRFKTATLGFPMSIALYSVASGQAFDHPFYQRIRGLGVMAPHIDERSHHVDLFAGMEVVPQVRDDERVLLADRASPGGMIAGIPFVWLQCVGRNFTTPYRGIGIVAGNAVPPLDASVAVYHPATVRFGPGPRPGQE